MTVLEPRLIDLDGVSLEVFAGGAGGPAVCSTHPTGAIVAGEWGEWFPLPGLADARRVVLINPRGLGKSSPVRRQNELTFGQLADDVEAVRERLGLGRWVFFGSSAGGCVALLYALRYPRSLAGLIVQFGFASGPRWVADPGYRGQRKRWFERLSDGSLINVAYRTEDMTIHTRAMMDELGTFDVQVRLNEIDVPTLVVAGRHDTTAPPDRVRDVHAGIAGSEFLLLEHSGHGVADEDREVYLTTVERFLATLTE
jgi:pimeloyl-ACP methyl ester carboxylesterase